MAIVRGVMDGWSRVGFGAARKDKGEYVNAVTPYLLTWGSSSIREGSCSRSCVSYLRSFHEGSVLHRITSAVRLLQQCTSGKCCCQTVPSVSSHARKLRSAIHHRQIF